MLLKQIWIVVGSQNLTLLEHRRDDVKNAEHPIFITDMLCFHRLGLTTPQNQRLATEIDRWSTIQISKDERLCHFCYECS
jgi:hypothetical protein